MKKENLFVILTGVVIGIAALVLTALGNPANMGFCIACFLHNIAGPVCPPGDHRSCARQLPDGAGL